MSPGRQPYFSCGIASASATSFFSTSVSCQMTSARRPETAGAEGAAVAAVWPNTADGTRASAATSNGRARANRYFMTTSSFRFFRAGILSPGSDRRDLRGLPVRKSHGLPRLLSEEVPGKLRLVRVDPLFRPRIPGPQDRRGDLAAASELAEENPRSHANLGRVDPGCVKRSCARELVHERGDASREVLVLLACRVVFEILGGRRILIKKTNQLGVGRELDLLQVRELGASRVDRLRRRVEQVGGRGSEHWIFHQERLADRPAPVLLEPSRSRERRQELARFRLGARSPHELDGETARLEERLDPRADGRELVLAERVEQSVEERGRGRGGGRLPFLLHFFAEPDEGARPDPRRAHHPPNELVPALRSFA